MCCQIVILGILSRDLARGNSEQGFSGRENYYSDSFIVRCVGFCLVGGKDSVLHCFVGSVSGVPNICPVALVWLGFY